MAEYYAHPETRTGRIGKNIGHTISATMPTWMGAIGGGIYYAFTGDPSQIVPAAIALSMLEPLSIGAEMYNGWGGEIGASIGDRIENSKLVSLTKAAIKRKKLNETLETVDLSGIKASYVTILKDSDLFTAENLNNIIKFKIYPPEGTKAHSEKLFVLNKYEFDKIFDVSEISEPVTVEAIFMNYYDLSTEKYADFMEECDEKLTHLNKRYGLRGICTFNGSFKLFFATNDENENKAVMYVESPNTKKPKFDTPIPINSKEEIMSIINNLKKQ